ncbi:MAG: hypothetical protein JW804_02895 [Sedimentisphaerales bacterium]|nr:hypothetical protein [Sedimentisphaerales bacterium]
MAGPKPVMVQGPLQWTADVEFTHIEQIKLKSGPDAETKRYWYIILSITNNTEKDINFYPNCELMTDTFQIIPAGRNVPKGVFDYIKKRHMGLYPFLEMLDTSGAKILQGEENARDLAIIWPDFDEKAKQISLFASGLSNETKVIELPPMNDSGEPTKVYLRKTLEMDYTISGDPKFRDAQKIKFLGQSWVMR